MKQWTRQNVSQKSEREKKRREKKTIVVETNRMKRTDNDGSNQVKCSNAVNTVLVS